MVGIVVLLPVSRQALYGVGVGIAVCLASMVFFLAVYPSNWNVQTATDYSAQGISLYVGGLAIVVASTGAALVAQHLERSRPAPIERDSREEISDERVARDIDEAMEGVNLSWGSIRRKETRKLAVDTGTDGVTVPRSTGRRHRHRAPPAQWSRGRSRISRACRVVGTSRPPEAARTIRPLHLGTARAKTLEGAGDEEHPLQASPDAEQDDLRPFLRHVLFVLFLNGFIIYNTTMAKELDIGMMNILSAQQDGSDTVFVQQANEPLYSVVRGALVAARSDEGKRTPSTEAAATDGGESDEMDDANEAEAGK